MFFYEVTLVNSGGAAGESEVKLTLREGIVCDPAQKEANSPDETEQSVRSAATIYESQGELERTLWRRRKLCRAFADGGAGKSRYAAWHAIGDETISCSASVEETALQAERMSVRGPIRLHAYAVRTRRGEGRKHDLHVRGSQQRLCARGPRKCNRPGRRKGQNIT